MPEETEKCNLPGSRPAACACCRIRSILAFAWSGVTFTPNQPSPTSPTRLSAGPLSPPKIIGGCGFCSGFGYEANAGAQPDGLGMRGGEGQRGKWVEKIDLGSRERHPAVLSVWIF